MAIHSVLQKIGLEYLYYVLLLVMLNVCVPRHEKHMHEKSTDSHKQFRKLALFPKTYAKVKLFYVEMLVVFMAYWR